MDLHDFEGQDLYFDEHMPDKISILIESASECYGTLDAEKKLRDAFFLAPENLSVLVALYRFYYYQHNYENALVVAKHALTFSGRRIQFPEDWQYLTIDHLGVGAQISMGMVRFYLLSLKAAAYINLRLNRFETAEQMLKKIIQVDSSDRLGAVALLTVAEQHLLNEQMNVANFS